MFYTIQHIRNAIRWTRFVAGACLLPLLLAGCADSTDSGFDGEQEHSKLTLLLNVNCDTQFLSRAESENPLGGQNGNGLRPGEHHENDIENLSVFAFANTDDNKNISGLPGTTVLKEACYVSNVNFRPSLSDYIDGKFTTEVAVDFNGSITSSDAFIVIANAGDVYNKLGGGTITLDAVRNYLIANTVTPATKLSDYTLFTMANARNSVNKGGDGTKKRPYIVSVDLERTTARVDFMFAPTLEAANTPAGDIPQNVLGYKVVDKYKVDGGNPVQTGWMYISHIKLMNVAQYAPYALKRLGSNSGSSTYFAPEQHVDDEAVQYVVEPNTWAKASTVDYSQLYGTTHIDYVSANYGQGIFAAREAVRNYATPQIAPNDNDGFNAGWSEDRETHEAYYVLDYVNENTVEKEYTTGKNTTSLLLKTKFVPKEMYYISGSELATKAAQYGETFWAMEVMESNGNRYKCYFADEDAAKLYRTKNPTVTTANPVKYTDGESYYTIWIRHDNNKNDALIGKMEYGIVRNNIYRIGVEKVLGPGSPVPVATENPEDVNLHIYVRKWNFMSVPTIYI